MSSRDFRRGRAARRPANNRPRPTVVAGPPVGDIVELEILDIAHGGVSVARHEGRVVFVADAIPGEKVSARITEASKKSFWRADTVSVIDASAHRITHPWAAAALERDPANRAGGAEFGHIALSHQRELKRKVLLDSLTRMASITPEVTVQSVGDDDATGGLGWRTRVRLHVDEAGRVGPYAGRSHTVIPVEDLPLATAALQSGAPLGELFPGAVHLDLVERGTGAAVFVAESAKAKPELQAMTRIVADREFLVAEHGFWQVHSLAAQTLFETVGDLVDSSLLDPKAANLDLFGGVGLLGAALAERGGPGTKITSVEGDEPAGEFAAENLAEWMGARAVTAYVEDYLNDLAAGPARANLAGATVVLDPPRAGLGESASATLAGLDPAQIVYVSCDPVTFARDTKVLLEAGYGIDSLQAFDLFPNTHHLETVARFTR